MPEFPPMPSNDITPEQSNVQNLYHVQLPYVLEDFESIQPLLKVLRTATPNDLIRLDINSVGGSLDIANQIVQYIKSTKATVNGYLYSACSAATLITLNCHNIILNETSYMMIHTASYGLGPQKHNNIEEMVTFNEKYLKDTLSEYYKNFLTEEEIKDVFSGTDMYMGFKEISKRLKSKVSKETKELKEKKA